MYENQPAGLENIPKSLPVLPIRDMVMFPHMVTPLYAGREKSINAVNIAINQNGNQNSGDSENSDATKYLLIGIQKNQQEENPKFEDINEIGIVASVLRMIKMPDNKIKILVQGITRAKINSIDEVQNNDEPYLQASIEILSDNEKGVENDDETEALIRHVKESISNAVSYGRQTLSEFLIFIEPIEEPGKLADIVISSFEVAVNDAVDVLNTLSPVERLKKVNQHLTKELSILALQQKIIHNTKGEMDKTQREYFLREQLRAIRKELGEDDDLSKEVDNYKSKIKKAKMPAQQKKEAEKELGRLAKMSNDSAEANVIRTYLDWLVELPWSKQTKSSFNINNAKNILDTEHHALKEPKERILDYLAISELRDEIQQKNKKSGVEAEKFKSPILCFFGAPGVGKTSLAKSIAHSLGRKYAKISLGGVRDEAEIRGHRRTYIGAIPGKIIQALKEVGTNNPVILLDEIDKVANDFRGNPYSALLEVLDPQQNDSFTDHYIAMPFDLSNVLFIATANYLDNIPAPLRDRLEIIEINGYTTKEKVEIAKQYIIPRQLKENGIQDFIDVKMTDDIIKYVIELYTRESGVRNLERLIGKIVRKVAREYVENHTKNKKTYLADEKTVFNITKKLVNEYLGAERYKDESELKKDPVGVVTGLAWTSVGGEVLYIEATKFSGKGNLINTGQLGDVMKESARIAFSYAKTIISNYGLDVVEFDKYDFHLHVPAGAIPKDGPSAGVTITTALISSITGLKINRDIAMTGEITLTGKVLPIGGIKEKLLAAKRNGVSTVIIPKGNESDVLELDKDVLEGIKIIYASVYSDVAKHIFLDNTTIMDKAVSKRKSSKSKLDTSTSEPAH